MLKFGFLGNLNHNVSQLNKYYLYVYMCQFTIVIFFLEKIRGGALFKSLPDLRSRRLLFASA